MIHIHTIKEQEKIMSHGILTIDQPESEVTLGLEERVELIEHYSKQIDDALLSIGNEGAIDVLSRVLWSISDTFSGLLDTIVHDYVMRSTSLEKTIKLFPKRISRIENRVPEVKYIQFMNTNLIAPPGLTGRLLPLIEDLSKVSKIANHVAPEYLTTFNVEFARLAKSSTPDKLVGTFIRDFVKYQDNTKLVNDIINTHINPMDKNSTRPAKVVFGNFKEVLDSAKAIVASGPILSHSNSKLLVKVYSKVDNNVGRFIGKLQSGEIDMSKSAIKELSTSIKELSLLLTSVGNAFSVQENSVGTIDAALDWMYAKRGK